MNAYLTSVGVSWASNLEANPNFEDENGTDGNFSTILNNDWQLTPSTPATISVGGINGAHSSQSWGFDRDLLGVSRSPLDDSATEGWSMGAYEY